MVRREPERGRPSAESGTPSALRWSLSACVLIGGLAYEAVLLSPLLAPYRFPTPYAVPIFDAPFALVGLGIAYLCLERHRVRQDVRSAALAAAMLLAGLLAVAHVVAQPDYPGSPGVRAGVAPYFFFLSYAAGLVGIGLASRYGSRRLALSDSARRLAALGVLVLAAALVLGVQRAEPLLPSLIKAPGRLTPFAIAVGGIVVGGAGVWALWGARRGALGQGHDPFTVLLCLAAVIWTLGLVGFLIAPFRYGVSWYVAGLARPVGAAMIFVALIREQARLYAEIEANLERLKETQAQLMQADKLAALGTLLSGMAHELNNPLSTILLSVQLAKQQARLPAGLRERLDVAEEECDRALRIVRNLLVLARRKPPERIRVDVDEIVRATLALEAPEFDLNRIRVTTALGAVPHIWADAHQLQQVLLNLFTNALHAMRTRPGGGELTVRSSRARGDVKIEVEDDGPGIPPDHLGRIFDPFFTTKSAGEGTGLGLSLSIGIVEGHGGRMTVENVPGRGARFTIYLPIGDGTETRETAPVSRPERDRRGRVLVVEDEVNLREAVVDVLASRGHRVEAVASGREAMARLENGRYDMIALDLRLPDADGRTVWEWLLARDPSAAGRVVFMTGDTMSPETQQFLDAAGRPVLAKPFTVDRLLGAVEAALDTPPAAVRA